jgi:hypothetical protein|tara:strand:- start:228 stop:953 length:726 start_codon:yes stop_codon:yes gene_type:complete
MSKGKKYSSFLTEQKIFDNWRNYLNENREDIKEAKIERSTGRILGQTAAGMGGAFVGGTAGALIGLLFGPAAVVMSPGLGAQGMGAGATVGYGLAAGHANRVDKKILKKLNTFFEVEPGARAEDALMAAAVAAKEEFGDEYAAAQWLEEKLKTTELSPGELQQIRFDPEDILAAKAGDEALKMEILVTLSKMGLLDEAEEDSLKKDIADMLKGPLKGLGVEVPEEPRELAAVAERRRIKRK